MAKKNLKIWKVTDLIGELSKRGIAPKIVRKPPKALWEKMRRVV